MEQPASSKVEPKKEGELKGFFESSHSPFGFVWQIAEATGWTVDYILWGVNYQTLLMMLADAPRYIDAEQAGEISEEKKEQETKPKTVMGFFQSRLNDER